MTRTSIAPPTGILFVEGQQHVDLRRHEPSDDLAFFVECHWVAEGDVRDGSSQRSDVLTYPCVNVVFEPSGPSAYGANTKVFARVLEGGSRYVATRFKAAGFQPFSRTHMSDLADRVVPLGEIFQMPEPAPDVLGAPDDRTAVAMVEDVLRAQTPARDPNVDLVNRMVAEIVDDQLPASVDALAERFGIPSRMLQRLFARYVGVSPTEFVPRVS